MKTRWPLFALLLASVPAFAGHSAMAQSVQVLRNVDVSGTGAYGGTSSDDDGTAWESLIMSGGKVGDIAVNGLSVVTELRLSSAAPRYVGHAYRLVTAHCGSVRIVVVAGRKIADADQCRVTQAVPK